MEKKSPAFQFYGHDFLMGTWDFSAEERGGFIVLLIHQWDKGSVPTDDGLLRKIAGCSKRALSKIKDKFTIDNQDGLLKNKRLEQVRKVQKEFSDKQRDKANSRWNKSDVATMPRHDSGISYGNAKPGISSLTPTLSSSSTLSSIKNNNKGDNELRFPKERKPNTRKKNLLFSETEFIKFPTFEAAFSGQEGFEDCDLKFYHEKVKNWSEAKGARRHNFISEVKNWMIEDANNGKLKLKDNVKSMTTKHDKATTTLTKLRELNK